MLSQIMRDFGEEIQSRHKSITIFRNSVLNSQWASKTNKITILNDVNLMMLSPINQWNFYKLI